MLSSGMRRMTKVGDDEQSLSFYQNLLNQPLIQTPNVQTGLNRSNSISAIRLQILHRIFDFLRRFNSADSSGSYGNFTGVNDAQQASSAQGSSMGALWVKTSYTSFSYYEEEATSFASTGTVKTSDGREINFGVEMSMSRSFSMVYEELRASDYFLTDPLVINMDTDLTDVSDFKFLFDLDCDGQKENISFAGKGSGFLALDLNEDGIINDGSELFGTKSGDGFKDLEKYDSDHNGWIDENDEIFDKLRVWTKDENGNDELIDLKKADVGAIHLGHVGTQFSLNDAFNNTNAYVRSSGIFLRESGRVGTMAQLDMTS